MITIEKITNKDEDNTGPIDGSSYLFLFPCFFFSRSLYLSLYIYIFLFLLLSLNLSYFLSLSLSLSQYFFCLISFPSSTITPLPFPLQNIPTALSLSPFPPTANYFRFLYNGCLNVWLEL